MVVNCLLFSKNVSLVNFKNNIKSYIDITIVYIKYEYILYKTCTTLLYEKTFSVFFS